MLKGIVDSPVCSRSLAYLIAGLLIASGCGKVQEIAQNAGDAAKNAVDQATAKPADTPATTPSSSASKPAAGKPSLDPEQVIKDFLAIPSPSITDANLAQLTQLGAATDSILAIDLQGNLQVTDAGMAHLGALTNLERVDLRSSGVTPAGLAHLKALPHLTWLHLGSSGSIDDKAAAVLSEFKHLKFLGLNANAITNTGLKSIAQVKTLEAIDLSGVSTVTGPGLAALVEMPALTSVAMHECTAMPDLPQGLLELVKCRPLRELDLSYCGLGDPHMIVFKAWPQLERLNLSDNAITDNGAIMLKQLGGLTDLNLTRTRIGDPTLNQLTNRKLAVLDLSETGVTDQGMLSLKRLTGLRVLNLSKAAISDLGLAQLKGLKNLEELNITGTKVDDQGLAHLVGMKDLKVLRTDLSQVTDAGRRQIADAIPGLQVDPQNNR